MDDNHHTDFSQTVDRLMQENPERPERSKFTYYDVRGRDIYRLLSDINLEIVSLHEDVMKNVFTDIDYYRIVGLLPMWLRDAGNSQESAMSRNFFEKLVTASSGYLVNKCLYYHDCEMLVNALQNRFNIVEALLIQVYDVLTPELKVDYQDYDNVIFTINEESQRVNAYINSIIINLASVCDIMTKIATELSEMSNVDYGSYPRMRSANTTYGQARHLPGALRKDNTLFADNRPVAVKKVEAIRDEIIHNGSLDFHSLIYYGVKGDLSEKWILMPAFTDEGTFTTFRGRKKFYDDHRRTWNRELPRMVSDFLALSLSTIRVIRANYGRKYYENADDLKKYGKEIAALSNAFLKVAKEESEKKV